MMGSEARARAREKPVTLVGFRCTVAVDQYGMYDVAVSLDGKVFVGREDDREKAVALVRAKVQAHFDKEYAESIGAFTTEPMIIVDTHGLSVSAS